MNMDYTIEDIEKFLKVQREYEQSDAFLSLKKLLSVSSKIRIFDGISNEELKGLVYDVKFRRYKRDETIIKEGSQSSSIFFILQGECHAYRKGVYLGVLHAGDAFGEIGVVTGSPRSANINCASKEALLLSFKIDQENLDFNARALAVIYKNLAKSINEKLSQLDMSATIKQQ